MVGPAGTGKTRTAIEMARAWHQARDGPIARCAEHLRLALELRSSRRIAA